MKKLLLSGLLALSLSQMSHLAFADPAAPQAAPPVNPTPELNTPTDKTTNDPVQRVLQAGLMKGYPDGNFHPEGHITRAELAHIAVKTFKVSVRQPQNLDKANMSDVPKDYWAYQDIKTALQANVMEGYRPGRFYPNQVVSRGEGFAILAQAYGVFNFEAEQVTSTLGEYSDSNKIPAWANKAWATALHEGFVNTDETAKTISPEKPMTRGDMAYALSKYLDRTYQEFPAKQ